MDGPAGAVKTVGIIGVLTLKFTVGVGLTETCGKDTRGTVGTNWSRACAEAVSDSSSVVAGR